MATGWKSGGRQAGTLNKATSTLRELVEAEAGEPVPVLLTRIGIRAMKAGDHQLAVNALSRAAVYAYPRIATADPEGGPSALIPPLVIVDDIVQVPEHWPGPVIRIAKPSPDE